MDGGIIDSFFALFAPLAPDEPPPTGIRLVILSLPNLFAAIPTTIELLVLSLALGLCVAVPVALLRLSRHPVLWMPAYGYIYFFRGTPLLVQLFLIYYGAGQFHEFLESIGIWWFFREAWWPCILALTLNTGAYTAEILRGAILGVPHGEIEAAKACGMSRLLLFRRIILPKAVRLVLPAYSNEVILMLQATSLASLVTITELTRAANIIYNRTYALYEMYLPLAVIYVAMTYAILWGFRALEHRLSGHLRDRPEAVTAKEPVAALTPGLR
jgi:octopine/nopaline transport system permease protein/arginine/ornithine transport system permease protein